MIISGTVDLAFRRELHAIQNLLTAIITLIVRQKTMYLLDPKLIYKQRKHTTSSNATISTYRPQDSASVFCKKAKAEIPIAGISLENLEVMLEPINCEISLYSKAASVLALWSKEEIGNTGWKTGKSISMFSLLYDCKQH
jgi:hypothetical protein